MAWSNWFQSNKPSKLCPSTLWTCSDNNSKSFRHGYNIQSCDPPMCSQIDNTYDHEYKCRGELLPPFSKWDNNVSFSLLPNWTLYVNVAAHASCQKIPTRMFGEECAQCLKR